MDLWDRFPHLAVTSPRERCGKSRLMELLEVLCLNGWLISNPSVASIFRRIGAKKPTLLLDEAQMLNRSNNSEVNALLNDVFCSSTSKTATIPRCRRKDKVGPDGEEFDVIDFSIYCPKAMALIGRLLGALPDRSLPIPMERKLKDEKTKRSRMRVWEKEGKDIANRLTMWSKFPLVRQDIAAIYERLDLLDIANERMAELLLPLKAVLIYFFGAENNYPLSLLEKYAHDLDRLNKEVEQMTAKVQLLVAIREEWDERKLGEFVGSACLVGCLNQRQDEPWPTWNRGEPMNEYNLRDLLKEYNIRPGRNKDRTMRGYHRRDFVEAWERYIFPADVSDASDVSGEE
jgi:hypothetical protein